MSVDYLLYRCPAEAGPMQDWESDMSLPIGSIDEVKRQISEVFPQTKWQVSSTSQGTWFGYTFPEFQVSAEPDGFVHTFRPSRAEFGEVLELAARMQLSAFDLQLGNVLEPN